MKISVYIEGKEGVQLVEVGQITKDYMIIGSKDGLALLKCSVKTQ